MINALSQECHLYRFVLALSYCDLSVCQQFPHYNIASLALISTIQLN